MSTIGITVGERTVTARLDGERVVIEGVSFSVERVDAHRYRVSDGARQWVVAVAGPPDARWVAIDGNVAEVEIVRGSGGRPRKARAARHDLSAPMPATVLKILVEPGAGVSRGDTLIVLEAMKMELAVRAPRDGRVRAIRCEAGELVQPGVPLLELE